MTAPLVLQVPVPTLSFTPAGGGPASLEQPVTIALAEVRFPDGSAMTTDDYAGATAVLSRVAAPGAAPEVWDGGSKTWRPAAGADLNLVGGVPLVPPPSGAAPWQGLLLSAALQDAAGVPQLQAAIAHYPRYTVRGALQAKRGATTAQGIGAESAPIEFAAGSKILEVDVSSGTPVITITNRTSGGSPLGRVRLEADGGITLLPLAGKRVVILGDLEAEHVRYLPVVGGLKADL